MQKAGDVDRAKSWMPIPRAFNGRSIMSRQRGRRGGRASHRPTQSLILPYFLILAHFLSIGPSTPGNVSPTCACFTWDAVMSFPACLESCACMMRLSRSWGVSGFGAEPRGGFGACRGIHRVGRAEQRIRVQGSLRIAQNALEFSEARVSQLPT